MIVCSKVPAMRFLKTLREAQGLTQYAMAKKLGLIINTYVQYETRAQGCNLEVLNHMRKILGLSWEELGRLIEKEIKENKGKNEKSIIQRNSID
jgi:transcriptional regulator with XRE-family HTH domain